MRSLQTFWVEEPDSEKAERKGDEAEKLQPKADYTAKGVEAAIPATVKHGLVL